MCTLKCSFLAIDSPYIALERSFENFKSVFEVFRLAQVKSEFHKKAQAWGTWEIPVRTFNPNNYPHGGTVFIRGMLDKKDIHTQGT